MWGKDAGAAGGPAAPPGALRPYCGRTAAAPLRPAPPGPARPRRHPAWRVPAEQGKPPGPHVP